MYMFFQQSVQIFNVVNLTCKFFICYKTIV